MIVTYYAYINTNNKTQACMISMGESEKYMCIVKLEPDDARSPNKDCVDEAADFDMTIYMYIYK